MDNRPEGWDWKQELKWLRSNMLVHSYIYYQLNDNIISDHKWQAGANRLTKLQNMLQAKGIAPTIGFYDEAFVGWDGSTGYHLPKDSWVDGKARHLLRSRDV